MKSKYFIISENTDGTFDIQSKNGRSIDKSASSYEINPYQPKYIKIKHDGGRWCSLYHYRGYAAKDTLWVHDIILNNDGSYQIKEYQHDKVWQYYQNPERAKMFFRRHVAVVSSVVLGCSMICLAMGMQSESSPKVVDSVSSEKQSQPVRVLCPKTPKTQSDMQDRSRE